jgi:hypothetical protein
MNHFIVILLLLALKVSALVKTNFPKGSEPSVSSQLVTFTENKGQVSDQYYRSRPDVLYSGTTGGLAYHLRKNGISYQISHVDSWKEEKNLKLGEKTKVVDQLSVYRLDINWLGSVQNPEIFTNDALPGYNNYYLAVCPNGVQHVKTFTGVTYKNIYKKIDLHYYQKEGQLKYDYIVAAGADYKQILLEIEGAEKISVNNQGDLIIATPLGEIVQQAPIVLQQEKILPSKWVITKDNANIVRFEINDINPNEAFIIDPVVRRAWSTYYGGSNTEEAYACATDKEGNVIMAGYTNSAGGTIISTPGNHQFQMQGSSDAFVVKFDAGGQRLWGTYFGGSAYERAYSVCTDMQNNVYIAGYTGSNLNGGITTPGCHQPNFGGANEDAFIAKFDSDGARKWSTYYGGFDSDVASSCTIDVFGDLYVAGSTSANNGTSIATAGGFQTVRNGLIAAFLVKFNTSGQRLWGTYYGSADTQSTYGYGCASDASGNIYLCGRINQGGSTLATSGSHQTTFGGGTSDGFLVKFNSVGVRLWATLYGGSAADQVLGCCTDIFNNVYITGFTSSSNAIAASGHQSTYAGVEDGFLVKLDSTGQRQWATYYGGIYSDRAYACFSDLFGNVYFSGSSTSPGSNVIATTGSQQTTSGGGGNYDAYLVKFNANGQRQWGTFYGGSLNDFGMACARDDFGNLYLAGYSGSGSSPLMVTTGAHQTVYGGSSDATLEKLIECPPSEPISTTLPQNLTICENETTTLTAIGSNNIFWFADSTGGVPLSNGPSFVTPTLNAGSYTFYAEAQSCTPIESSAIRTAITVNVEVCTGIVKPNVVGKPTINIYPNPADGIYFVELTEASKLKILDCLGQVIFERQLSTGKNIINLDNYSNGVYFFSIKTANNNNVFKVLKN